MILTKIQPKIDNLGFLRPDYQHLIVEKFSFGDLNYISKGSINQLSINLYIGSLINIQDKSLEILCDGVYYYDSTKNNYCLTKLDNQDKKLRIKKLLDEKYIINLNI